MNSLDSTALTASVSENADRRRFLCLYFSRWPIQRLLRGEPELRGKPLAVYERGAHGPRLVACSPEAGKRGVETGMPVSEATALAPDLLVCEIDRAADRNALEKLALWAGRFSPCTGVEQCGPGIGDHPQSLLLEITGCEQVFDGEDKLLRQALKSLTRQQLRPRAAIAPTLGAAWALAHFGAPPSGAIVPEAPAGALNDALAPLSLAALRLPPPAVAWLSKLGLNTVGDVFQQPRATLPSRFGPELIERLDQALGTSPETFPWLRPPPEIVSAQAFEYAITDRELLLHSLARRIDVIVRELQRRCRGARSLECWLYREAADPILLEVHLFRSSAAKKHLLQLLRTRLEDFRFGAEKNKRSGAATGLSKTIEVDEGFCALSVGVTSSELLSAEQLALFSKPRGAPSGLAMTLDRIRTHCGRGSVFRVREADDAQPEFAYALADCEQDAPMETEPAEQRTAAKTRPLHLLAEPAPIDLDWPAGLKTPRAFDWRGERIAITQATGPERIDTGWWRTLENQLNGNTARDYYTVISPRATQYWIFRRLADDRWFLHGIFD
jgi:protein ImuB